MHGYLFEEQLEEIEIKYPATWWDAFKEKYKIPFLKPPLYKRVRLELVKQFPTLRVDDLKIEGKKHRGYLRTKRWENEDYSYEEDEP